MSLTTSEVFDFGLNLIEGTPYEPPPDPVEWMMYNFIDPISKKLLKIEDWQARIIRRALSLDDNGYSRYNTIVWSQPKKSGKTTIASAVGVYVAANIETPNEISCLANDQEQSAGRIFGHMLPSLENLQWKIPASKIGIFRQPMAFSDNGTFVKAITTDHKKEAGGNQGLSLWSELWAYDSERLNRLWDEMTPPPTRRFRMRWIETYAGYIGESLLLQGLYLSVFKDFKEKELQDGVIKIWDDLPVYEPNPHTLIFWDHEHRMAWQTEEYYNAERTDMRPSAYTRLHGNWWVESNDSFISSKMWYQSVRDEVKKSKAIYALDASKDGDCAALIGCRKRGELVETTDIHIWQLDGKELNFKEVENTILKLWKQKLLHPPLFYDPYQCAKLAQDLRAKGLRCEEFKQGVDRIKSDTFLYKLYKEGTIINPDHSLLRSHVLAAQAKTYADNRIRIVKPQEHFNENPDEERLEEAIDIKGKKVDAIVAQSMAAYKCYMHPMSSWGVTSGDIGN